MSAPELTEAQRATLGRGSFTWNQWQKLPIDSKRDLVRLRLMKLNIPSTHYHITDAGRAALRGDK